MSKTKKITMIGLMTRLCTNRACKSKHIYYDHPVAFQPHHRAVVYRVPKRARKTGHVANGWMGGEYEQWEATVTYFGREVTVWGYSSNGCEPIEWFDDTF